MSEVDWFEMDDEWAPAGSGDTARWRWLISAPGMAVLDWYGADVGLVAEAVRVLCEDVPMARRTLLWDMASEQAAKLSLARLRRVDELYLRFTGERSDLPIGSETSGRLWRLAYSLLEELGEERCRALTLEDAARHLQRED